MSSPELTRVEVLRVLRKHKVIAAKYLDMGCGDGSFTLEIAKIVKAEEVWGVDKEPRGVPKPIKLLTCDLAVERVPLPSNYFDLITAIEVLEHLPYGDNLVAEASRLLKRGGLFLLTTPNLASWINRVLLLFGYQVMHVEPSRFYHIGLPLGVRRRQSYAGHLMLYTLRGLTDMLKVYGFDVIDKKGVHWPVKNKLLSYLDIFFSKRTSLAQDLVILARKL
jgi:SAM-dependent methyltransferase